jgi:hypothetical protein
MEETYEQFIQNILNTRGRFACGDEYHERHHVIPKCIGGGDEEENLIDLFAREHFIAHKLLALENPNNEKLAYAWNMMCNSKNGDYQITAEEYEKARMAFASFISESKKGKSRSEETCDKLSKYMKAQWENPEWRNNMMELLRPTYEDQQRNDKLSEKTKERFKNPENHPLYGKHHTEESKRKNSESHKGKFPSAETRIKLSESRRGEKNHNYGKPRSEEAKKKQSETMKGRYCGENNPNYGNHKLAGKNHPNYGKSMSEEQKKKLSDAAQGKYIGEKNPRARKVIRLSDLKIYGYITEAAQDNGVTRNTMRKRCEKHQDFMFYDEYLAQQND